MTPARRRIAAFSVLAIVTIAATVGYLVLAASNSTAPATSRPTPQSTASVAPAARPYIAFQQTRSNAGYGTVGTVPHDDPSARPTGQDLACERIHVSRYGGVCLAVDRGAVTTAQVLLLNADLSVRYILSTPGIPSRARVSPDGRWAATTTFVFGHSYASSSFSTQTEVYDMATGESLGNLEDWAVRYQGQPYDAEDLNVWGVTFSADGSSFYATVMTAGRKHLARGDIAARTLEMTDVTAECPSLSPDGTRLAFKSATSPDRWQVTVRSLADGREVVVDESRSVDDQIEWLDDDRVVYGLDRSDGAAAGATTDVWVAAADGSAPSTLFIEGAWSPAVVRVP